MTQSTRFMERVAMWNKIGGQSSNIHSVYYIYCIKLYTLTNIKKNYPQDFPWIQVRILIRVKAEIDFGSFKKLISLNLSRLL